MTAHEPPDLGLLLVTLPPRETGGATASNRIVFQWTWTICKAIALHEAQVDYVLVLEHHDDVLVLTPSASPNTVDSFQIKTRTTGSWSSQRLIAQPKTTRSAKQVAKTGTTVARSILGKLLVLYTQLGDHVAHMHLVSNAPFNIELTGGASASSRSSVCLSELGSTPFKEIESAVRAELGETLMVPWERVSLETTDIPVEGHATYGAGRLSEYLHRRRPGHAFAVQALYQTLQAEVERRATRERQAGTFDELARTKGLSRALLEGFFAQAEALPRTQDLWPGVEASLRAEHVDYRRIQRLRKAWVEHEMAVMNAADVDATERQSLARMAVAAADADTTWESLVDYMAVALSMTGSAPKDRLQLEGAILYEHAVTEARKSTSPTAKPEGEAK